MSSDFHIKLDGVSGESTHKNHKDEIEILSWSWGVVNASGSGSGGGSGKGKATPQELTFMHKYDKASPVLAQKCADGKHFKDLVLTCRKSGDGQQEFLKVSLKEVFISTVQINGSQGGDLLEAVSVSFKDIETAYKPQDDKGAGKGEVKFGWNIAATEVR
ncbi:Hcp family type VI secretion system effector [Diaphorobacter aerolatus]|uniref:Type VI secretion system tube protein Hcp n=1 Tax=Diaphorobacter aerolatus TaxID=1288495 RepID=A0A7H0GLI7_9BURK|nr:type VI secretion system tube protein Hcp [Diaphorobacter aerolatus]QNP49153.1 type VI secretion system tube protein Hcp [Diaphorobacter aerolatus]